LPKIIHQIAAGLLLAAAPAAAAVAQEAHGEWDMSVSQMQEAVEHIRTDMFTPGERVAGWDRGGANPDADLRAMGADSHFYRVRSVTGDGVTILTDRPITAFAPTAWRAIDSYGSQTTRVDNPIVAFEALSPRYVVGLRAGSARRNDADCVDEIANATLYERPGAAASQDDEAIPLFFRLVLLAGEGQTVCSRYSGDREAGYRSIPFLPDGRTLPRLIREDELITIIPAGPIDPLVTFIARSGA
jgi:hypothetical protein